MTAMDSPELREVRRCVPEFEPVMDALLHSEGPDIGTFEVMSVFARWVLAMDAADQADVVERSSDVVERLLTSDRGFPQGQSLAAEFVEVVGPDDGAASWMRPATKALARGSS